MPSARALAEKRCEQSGDGRGVERRREEARGEARGAESESSRVYMDRYQYTHLHGEEFRNSNSCVSFHAIVDRERSV